ncbi:uncharacterized protein MONBRDRAFT_15040 [Monosiga brevicollis MX1]|uniref:Fascin domain-containing protein n=1 Tax=Monosiga brevicollis TaxID=81824 RepID=A9UTE4_MONBE|nr:uncharacterized protein MONBRDRAFT_15040 [Monosiga brevicollis MX1]EDQ91477.1 predicted protein [Monosiga brevicollis MX1]|eukprot:XP_001743899.1 hypothetical protein [Monosiga brevicollis MX1]
MTARFGAKSSPHWLIVGAWWQVAAPEEFTGNLLLECDGRSYVMAIDDGSLTASEDVAKERDGPVAQEVFTIIKVSDARIAIKTAFNRYVTVDDNDDGVVYARAEAIGALQLFQAVWTDETHVSLRGPNKKFLSILPGRRCTCNKNQMDLGTTFQAFSCAERKEKKKKDDYNIEGGSLKNMEEAFAMRFQSGKNGKWQVSEEDARDLGSARRQGRLHESLLDRRAKVKADRYCK